MYKYLWRDSCAYTINGAAVQPIINYIIYCGSIENSSSRQLRGRFSYAFFNKRSNRNGFWVLKNFYCTSFSLSFLSSLPVPRTPRVGCRCLRCSRVKEPVALFTGWPESREDSSTLLYIRNTYTLHSQWAGYIIYVLCLLCVRTVFFLILFFPFCIIIFSFIHLYFD